MDKNTAEKLYEAFYMKVFSYAMTLTGNREDAMEITQETFFRAISTEKTFRGESDGATWLCAIAKNLFVDEKRRQSRFTDAPISEEQPDEGKSMEESLADADTSLRIHRVLHNLEEPYKEVFQLRVFGELSFKEIGSIFGKTETWARVTFHRARMMVKERMEKS
ncbi:MAG: RNA polymerase sigma factor [Lachnospiraceae bacterium]|nr:RNA polymerase sigma factor [Lachnospiraceae bacterium]